MFLYSMRPYVIVVGFVRVPGVPVLVKSGHRALLMGPLKMVVNVDRNM